MIRTAVKMIRKRSLFLRKDTVDHFSRFMYSYLFQVCRLLFALHCRGRKAQGESPRLEQLLVGDVIQNNWDYSTCIVKLVLDMRDHCIFTIWRNCYAGAMTRMQVPRQASRLLRCTLVLRPRTSRYLCVPSCFIVVYKMPSIVACHFLHHCPP